MPTHEQIALEALDLWIRFDKPEGMDEAIWLLAEASLRLASLNAAFFAALKESREE